MLKSILAPANFSFLILLTLLPSAPKAHAISYPQKSLEKQVKDMLHNVAIVDEDGRMTEEEYATFNKRPVEEVRNKFAATGILDCGEMIGSAQLTGDNQTITTAAHMFVDRTSCRKLHAASSCQFKVKIGKKIRIVEVSGLVGMGFKCPALPRQEDDWAVLKLRSPLLGMKPYLLPDKYDEIHPNERMISVSAYSMDFQRRNSKTGKKEWPKSIEECDSKRGYRTNGVVTLVASNCDSSGGNSGGSLLKESDQGPVLAAISVGNSETDKDRAATFKGVIRRGPYVEDKWATFHVRLSGEFLDTIERALGK